MIKRLTIIGVGLIGGSLARALRVAGACEEIVGWGRSPEPLQRALELGVIDRAESDIAAAVKGADVVLIGVPVGAMEAVLQQLKPHLEPQAVVTDVGSTKGSVVAAARKVFGILPPRFIPGHPIAGTEKSGAEASFAELFRNRRVILTPDEESDPDALALVRQLWQQAGAEVIEMSVEHHDEVLAATSHLPHMLAFTLVDTLARLEDHDDIFRFAAGGFRDFTRIASSDPQMWHDICLNNRDALLQMLRRFTDELNILAGAIEAGDGEALLETFERAKAARDDYCEKSC
ncbi:MAG: prephenate dehydrogenase/arogenate dehydrogenase family protein [Gammaproteobacteria bacterium]|nr:prephenate dehydrogenase/arogenate dehydrogenase family protein [Gammaproteobacteria bacterium]MCW8973603.1 prephenate dehydrogenase/arogenate dehydrogenase family protein [Gammaproteobacteria bacterium]MCW8993279.1 prephenate dehydrogenase/arogenate dehydrogenase family protein [Gammaproteobacteria bacterium]